LLAVVIIFLGRPHPKKLLTFFLAGAMLASVSIGIAAVNFLDAADIGSSTRRSVNSVLYLTFGVVSLVVGLHFLRTRPKPKLPRKEKGPSLTQRVLTKDSTWLVFLLGVVLNLPGLWYLLGLKNIALADYGPAEEVLLVLGFNLIMFSFVEIPLVGYLVAPAWSHKQVDTFNAWLHEHGRRLGGWIGVVVGVYLLTRGIVAAV
jgi:sulfite exporter TauE/SafE